MATLRAPITSCSSANRGATRVVIPADGTEDDVANPPRIAPRNLFDLGVGVDNVFDKDPPLTGVNCTAGFCNGNTFPQVYDALGRFVFVGLSADF